MNFRNYTLIIFFLISNSINAQKYGNVWHFGDQAGIDFKSCKAEAFISSSITGFEGCAAICDNNGNILFYTNSDVVWNKTNSVMSNGNLISSSGSLSQVLIIPKPGSTTIFYIITTKIQASGNLTMQYHTIDMLQNSGLGEVVSSNNVMTTWNITEQVAATTHANGTDIWVMTHEYGTDKFLSFLVTSGGINLTPIISSIGPTHVSCTSNINSRGEIKFSPDGSMVAFNGNGVGNNSSTNILALFDFDNATGIVSNAINLPYSNGEFGLSFSPDNSKLYGSTWKAFAFGAGEYNYIYQFDLSSGNPNSIINSKVIIDSVATNSIYGSMKIGPDGKIYVARMNSQYVGVINEPNLVGVACNYVSNGFYLDGKICKYGLNNYIEYQTYCTPATSIDQVNAESNLISIFPNPVSEKTKIKIKVELKKATMIVFNSLNQEISRIVNVSGNQFEFDSNNLPAGLYYILLIEDNSEIARNKFVKVE